MPLPGQARLRAWKCRQAGPECCGHVRCSLLAALCCVVQCCISCVSKIGLFPCGCSAVCCGKNTTVVYQLRRRRHLADDIVRPLLVGNLQERVLQARTCGGQHGMLVRRSTWLAPAPRARTVAGIEQPAPHGLGVARHAACPTLLGGHSEGVACRAAARDGGCPTRWCVPGRRA